MAGVNRLTGIPWHIERYTREDGDDRRHRSRCIYYQKSDTYCSHVVGKCCGSAHCSYYTEFPPEDCEDTPSETKDVFKKHEMSDFESRRLFPIGCKVRHIKYGSGTVKKILDGKIVVEFKDEAEKTFGLDFCTNHHLLVREDK